MEFRFLVESTKIKNATFLYKTAPSKPMLRILTGKEHPKIKLQRLQKIRIWTFGLLVHQINSFQEVLKLKQIFQKK